MDLVIAPSDHDHLKYGPGYWKCNVSILSDPELIDNIYSVYNNELSQCVIKDGEWWESCKRTFRKIIISHSRRISCKLKRKIKEIEENLRYFTKFATSDPEYFQPYANQLKDELNDLIIQKYMGSVIRSRAQYVENYEKPNRYFLRVEKAHAKNKCILQLKNNNDEMISDPQKIMEACRDFYADLYKKEPIDQEAVNDFFI